MKVQLVVVQGKPEGMVIPLSSANYKIGRGEGCQLRPNSDLVSREHAQFVTGADSVLVQDLGSRNGTEVNGKRLAANQPQALKSGDLIKVGTLDVRHLDRGSSRVEAGNDSLRWRCPEAVA